MLKNNLVKNIFVCCCLATPKNFADRLWITYNDFITYYDTPLKTPYFWG